MTFSHVDLPHGFRVLVIEDHPSTRRLLRNHLLKIPEIKLEVLNNGGKLLKSSDPINADLVLLGMELENSYWGVDLIRQLVRLKKLPPWTKVFFITNQTFDVATNLPFMPLACEIFPKPINLTILSERIITLKPINQYYRKTLGKFDEMSQDQMLDVLKHTPAELKGTRFTDDIKLIRIHVLLRLKRPGLAMDVADTLESPELRIQRQLHYSLFFGDANRFEQAVSASRHKGLLKKKSTLYTVLHHVIDKQLDKALEQLQRFPEHTLTPPEIALKAQLLLYQNGLWPAIDYLKQKMRVTLENHYVRSALTVYQMCIYQLAIFSNKTEGTSFSAILQDVEQLQKEYSLYRGSDDYASYLPFLTLSLQASGGNAKRVKEELVSAADDVKLKSASLDFIKLLVLAFVYAEVGEKALFEKVLINIIEVLADTEVSSEFIQNIQLFDEFMQRYFDLRSRCSMLNKWGVALFEKGHTAAALRLFYRAFKLDNSNSVTALNLYSALKNTQLDQYWELHTHALASDIGNMPLNDKQAANFRIIHAS